MKQRTTPTAALTSPPSKKPPRARLNEARDDRDWHEFVPWRLRVLFAVPFVPVMLVVSGVRAWSAETPRGTLRFLAAWLAVVSTSPIIMVALTLSVFGPRSGFDGLASSIDRALWAIDKAIRPA